jgi:MHS family proline/betaine transporter-like MFS transporter
MAVPAEANGEKDHFSIASDDNEPHASGPDEHNGERDGCRQETVHVLAGSGMAHMGGHHCAATAASEAESIEGGEATRMQTIAGVAGNVLEWYDFAVFGFFGDIIGEVFFPPQAGNAAIVESFAVFGGAFLMRPIGGMLIGYIGDRYGRKTALELSIFLMALPTFTMGCLPGYERIGSLAVVLLAITRCMQGLSVGGQLMSSLVFTLEKHPKKKWGLYGSYVMAAANCGTLLGGLVAFSIRASLSDEALRRWGWRVPFLCGILVSFTGLYLKYHCPEVHALHGSHAQDPQPNPIKAAFSKENRRSLLSASLVPMLWSGGFYITFVWLSIFMSDLIVPPVPGAFAVNSASLFCICLVFPLGGILSDWFGRKKVMLLGGIGMGVFSPLCIIVIGWGNPFASFFAQTTMGSCLTLWGAPMMAWLVEGFPPAARLTSVGIGYNIAQATSGGFAPAVATMLVDKYGKHAPGFILTGLAVLSSTGLLVAPRHSDGLGTRGEAEQMQIQHEEDAFSATSEDHFDQERCRSHLSSDGISDSFRDNNGRSPYDNTREIT